jgi:DNA-binding NarL/FixJ family response regulator
MGLVDSPALVVLDDHELVRDGMERQLTTDFPGARVVYSGDSLLDALKATATSQCDCAVVDLDLGDQTPVAETVSAFTARGIPVVVVSAMARPDVLQAAMAAGAQAFIAKRSSLRNLSMAVRTVLDGGTWFSAQEKRALVLYASGLTLEMVARRMEITPNTVKHYLDRVRDKYTAAGIAARTKMQLHQVARLEGLLP